MRRVVNRMNDYAFKRIFGSPENCDILMAFCNAVLDRPPGEEIASLELLDRELDPEYLADKAGRLDILARTASGTLINIEVQVQNVGDTRKRMLFYWSRLYVGQLASGADYYQLAPTISVNVLNFVELPGEDYHSVFTLRRQEDGYRLIEDLELHFLELPKMRALKRLPRTPLEKWLFYLNNAEGEAMDQIAKEVPMIQKARTVEELFMQMEHERRLYELREKWLHDIATLQKHARQEGHKEGVEEGRREGIKKGVEKGRKEGVEKGRREGVEKGRKEGLRTSARNMLRKGMPMALVAEVTGLSPDEVAALMD